MGGKNNKKKKVVFLLNKSFYFRDNTKYLNHFFVFGQVNSNYDNIKVNQVGVASANP